jgi:hypothetical protein
MVELGPQIDAIIADLEAEHSAAKKRPVGPAETQEPSDSNSVPLSNA